MIEVPYEPRRKSPVQRPPTPPKRGLLSRVILAGEVVLTSLEASVANIVTSGTAAASTAAG
jgi:spartin